MDQNLLGHRGNPPPCTSPRDTFHESFIPGSEFKIFRRARSKSGMARIKALSEGTAQSLDLLIPTSVCLSLSLSLSLEKIWNSLTPGSETFSFLSETIFFLIESSPKCSNSIRKYRSMFDSYLFIFFEKRSILYCIKFFESKLESLFLFLFLPLDSSFLLEKEGEKEEGWRERDAATTEIMQIGLETLQRRVFDAASRITYPSLLLLLLLLLFSCRGSIIGFPWRILGSL